MKGPPREQYPVGSLPASGHASVFNIDAGVCLVNPGVTGSVL